MQAIFAEGEFAEMGRQVVLAIPQIAVGVGVFLVFWLIGLGVGKLIGSLGRNRGIEIDLARFIEKVVRVVVVLFGAVTALGTMGVDVAALVAGIGLTGFALGFALKDIVSNVLAGVLIMMYKPFGRGDEIKVKSFEGTVSRIDLRYTVLDSNDQTIYVPNSILFTDPIIVDKPVSETEPPASEMTPPPDTTSNAT